MAEHQPINIKEVPSALRQLVQVNVEYKVLICLGNGCSRAVRPATFLRHARDWEHPMTKASRQQAQEYIAAFLYDYNHSTVALPPDGLAPQRVIPVADGFQCRKCPPLHPDGTSRPYRSQ